MIDFGDILNDYIERERESESGKLWPSSLGGCIRKEMMRFKKIPQTHPHSPATLWQFERYKWYETVFREALLEPYAVSPEFDTQVDLENKYWHGKADFRLPWEDEHNIATQYDLLEVKSVSPYARLGELPYPHHLPQCHAYYSLALDTKMPVGQVYLVYITRWADGDVPKILTFDVTPTKQELTNIGNLMHQFEAWSQRPDLPPLPYSKPTEHPWECTAINHKKKRVETRCTWFGRCWEQYLDYNQEYIERPF